MNILTSFWPSSSSTPVGGHQQNKPPDLPPLPEPTSKKEDEKLPTPPPLPQLQAPVKFQSSGAYSSLAHSSPLLPAITQTANSLLVDDILQLPTIAPSAVVELLRTRFSRDEVYTNLGRLILAINPYRRLDRLYSESTTAEYSRRASAVQSNKYLAPHLYTIGNDALENVRRSRGDQIISISGESGSGKTESARLLISYIVNKNNNSTDNKLRRICQQIMDGLGILESFGNASTSINFNSSRHGRLIDLAFQESNLVAVQVSDYLLERSRVVCHSMNEKNYHIFYEFIGGLTEDQRRSYQLDTLITCDYFSTGIPQPTPELRDRFSKINARLVALGFNAEELKALWTMLACVCHLGTIKFDRFINENGVVGEIQLASLKPLQTIANLMKLSEGTLATLLTVRTTDAGGERLTIPLTPEQSFVVRDAIAKFIYAKLFSWLSSKVNTSLSVSLQSANPVSKADVPINHIGILDIFGFEDFNNQNSLEQLCINFASESLHAYFLKEVIKMEQESYIRDGLKWAKIEMNDNANCIDLLINKKIGIMTILDDHSFMPNASDVSFLNKCNELNRSNLAYDRAKSSEEFGIAHYAGKVWYNTRGFLEKNRDANRPDIVDMLIKSQNPIIASVFASTSNKSQQQIGTTGTTTTDPPPCSPPRRTRCFTTVSSMYQESLSQLIAIVNRCQPHFVRCIRPNRTKKPGYFDPDCVLDQLRCGGIIDAARVRKAGYPARLKHAEFVSTYAPLLVTSEAVETLQPPDACRFVLTKIGAIEVRDYQVGRTTVFLTDSMLRRLEAELQTKRWSAISKWQKTIFRYLDERREVRRAEEKKRIEEENKRLQEEADLKAKFAAVVTPPGTAKPQEDSAIAAPTPLVQPLMSSPSEMSRDFLQEVITYLHNWQLVDDDRHVIPAATNFSSVISAIPSDPNILKTVVGAFMQTLFPNVKNQKGGNNNSNDSTTVANPQDVAYVSRIVSMFLSDKKLSGLQQLILATLIVVSCQGEGVEALLYSFHNNLLLANSSNSSNSPNNSTNNSSGNGKNKMNHDYVISEIIRSLNQQSLTTESKSLLWLLLLHVISSYDVPHTVAKLILTTIAADSPGSTSLTAPHLVLFIYQKMFPVMRQLVRFAWSSNRILAPCLLEWVTNIRLCRMALMTSFIDGSNCVVEVTSHSSVEDFASSCIRTKFHVSSDIPPQLLYTGWAVNLAYGETERVELWPEAKVLDLVSHIEIPAELQPKGRFPGLGLIRPVPAVIAPNNSGNKQNTTNTTSFMSGIFAQVSAIQNNASQIVNKTAQNVVGPRQTSTPKMVNLGLFRTSDKHVSFDEGKEGNNKEEAGSQFIRQPSLSSTNSNLARIDDYINNLFDFGGGATANSHHAAAAAATAAAAANLSSLSNALPSNSTASTIVPISGFTGVTNTVDTRSLYTHMNNTVVENTQLQESSGGKDPLSVSASTNVRQAARVLDRFLKPEMINIQQAPSQTALAMLTRQNFRSTFTSEGNSLYKLLTVLDDQMGGNALETSNSLPFMTYSNPQWQLVAFKAFLTPSESKSLLDADRSFLRLILAQIVNDAQSMRPGMFSRLSNAEHVALLNMLYTRKLTKASILASETFTSGAAATASSNAIDIDFMKLVVKMAVDMKLYFAAIYPVSGVFDESGVSMIVTDLAMAPRYLSLISRRIDPLTSSRILDVVKSFLWTDVDDVVIAGESSVKIAVANLGEFSFSSDNVDLLADRLSAFTIEAQATVKFQASRDCIPSDAADHQLVLRKNDIIYVLDPQPQDGLLYGTCRGRCGFFPIAAVAPMDLSIVPLELRRHFADKRIQDCDLIVDAGSLTSEHLVTTEGWLQRGDSDSRPADKGDNLANLVKRLSLRRQREIIEQQALGGNPGTALDNFNDVILLNVNDDLRPLCAQCSSLIGKFLKCEDGQIPDPGQQREFLSGIIATGLQYPLINDETFLQTVKQLVTSETTPPSSLLVSRTLCLLSILAKFFRCSDTLRPYIFLFLAEQLSTGKNREIILECAASISKLAVMGSRRSLPSSDEIDYCCSLIEGRRNPASSVFVRIFLPGQRRVACYVDSCSLVREIVDTVMAAIGVETPTGRVGVGSLTMKLSLTESYEYRLYYRKSPKEPFVLVTGASYILDLFKSSSNDSAPQHLDLVIRRLSWLFPVRSLLSLSASTERATAPNPFLVDMLSFQMMRSWLEANWSPLHVETQDELVKFVATTAALHHRASIAATEERPPSASELSTLMPRWVYQLRPDWLRSVQQTYFDVAAKLSPQSARRQLTSLLVKECPLGAASFFVLLGAYLPTSALRGAALLGLNAKGVVILHPETRVPLFFAGFPQILSLSVENNTTSSSNNPQRQAPPGSVQVVLRMSPSVLLPPEARANAAETGGAPVTVRLISLPSDCLIQVLQHHIDLYAAINGKESSQ